MSSRQLACVGEARELLNMVEFLLEHAAYKGGPREFPLGGMRITIGNISRHLAELERMLGANTVETRAPAPAAQAPAERKAEVENGANGGIASRIQMAPIPRTGKRGYTREIASEDYSRTQDTSDVD